MWRRRWRLRTVAALGDRFGVLPADLGVVFATAEVYERLGVLDDCKGDDDDDDKNNDESDSKRANTSTTASCWYL